MKYLTAGKLKTCSLLLKKQLLIGVILR